MDLFGRKRLKQRIEELEEELEQQEQEFSEKREQLEERLEKESERARKAAREKQDAEEHVNRLQDKVESLQDRLERDSTTTHVQHEETTLHLPKAQEMISNLDIMSFSGEGASSYYSTPEDSITGSSTGEAVFAADYLVQHAIIPPLPFEETKHFVADSFRIQPLAAITGGRYCFIHLSAGGSGACLVDDGNLEDTAVVSADVKSKHKKGGYSQKRFERLRDEQVEDHLDSVMDAAEPFLDEGFDRLILAGTDRMVEQIDTRINVDSVRTSSRVSKITEEDDLATSFNHALSCKVVTVSDEEIERLEQR